MVRRGPERERHYVVVSKQDYSEFQSGKPPSPDGGVYGTIHVDLLNGIVTLPEGEFDMRSFLDVARRIDGDRQNDRWYYSVYGCESSKSGG